MSSSLARHNLNLVVSRAPCRIQTLADIIRELLGDLGPAGGRTAGVIVYCSTQYGCIKVARDLRVKGIPAEAFHAGLAPHVRRSTQDRFVKGDESCRVVVGTLAFGLGVNKADVRGVIHLESPPSVEDW